MRTIMVAMWVLSVFAASAMAQVNPFGRNTIGLKDSDFKMMIGAAESLYRNRAPVRHASKTWRNPQSGNAGVVLVAEVATAPELCVTLAHRYRVAGQADSKTFLTKRCKSVSGNWDLVLE